MHMSNSYQRNTICRQCINRKFDSAVGLLCGYTGSKPDFSDHCQFFESDQVVAAKSVILAKPNSRRAKTAMLMVSLVMFINLIKITSLFFQYQLLAMVKAGEAVTEKMAASNDIRQLIVDLLFILIFLISAVTFIMWFRRAYFNMHKRIRSGNFTEGWAAGSWFVPVLCFFRPFQIMREMWRESASLLVLRADNMSFMKSRYLLGIWWTFWILASFVGSIADKLSNDNQTIDQWMDYTLATMILAFLYIPLSLITLKVISVYNQMESALAESDEIVPANASEKVTEPVEIAV
jgi:hypothetical protein